MIVLDASVLIAHLEREDVHHDAATAHLLAYADHPFGASVVSVAEVLIGPARAGRTRAAEAALRQLGLAELPLEAGSSRQLASLRSETKLKLPDCCVLLAAETNQGRVLTFDERLAREAARLGLA